MTVPWLELIFGQRIFLVFVKMSWRTSMKPVSLPRVPVSWIDLRSHAAVELGKKLFPLFALALDLPEDFFDAKVCIIDYSTFADGSTFLEHLILVRQRMQQQSCVYCITLLKLDPLTTG